MRWVVAGAVVIVSVVLVGAVLIACWGDEDGESEDNLRLAPPDVTNIVVEELRRQHGDALAHGCKTVAFGDLIKAWVVECSSQPGNAPVGPRELSLWHVNDETSKATRIMTDGGRE